MPRPKLCLAWSGGKDSAWALHLLRQAAEFDVVALVTTLNGEFQRIVSNNPVSRQDSDEHLMSIWQYWASLNAGFGSSYGESLEGGVNGDASASAPDHLAPPASVLDGLSQQAEDRYVSITQNDYDPEGIATDTTDYVFSGGSNSPKEKQAETIAIQWGKSVCPSEGTSSCVQQIYDQLVAENVDSSMTNNHPGEPEVDGLVGGHFNFLAGGIIVNGENLDVKAGRTGFMNSNHFEKDPKGNWVVHNDSMNSYVFPIGTAVHALRDVYGGHHIPSLEWGMDPLN